MIYNFISNNTINLITNKIILFIFIILLTNTIYAQTILPPLSQNTNLYFYQSSKNLNYISSTDGLNIFNGINNTIYRSSTHNMYGDNIQSDFHEDYKGRVWFSTYEAINVHDPKTDKFEYFFCKREDGSTIKNDYRIIDLENDILWILADNLIFKYDVNLEKIIEVYPSLVRAIFEINKIEHTESVSFKAISPRGFYAFEVNKEDKVIIDSFYLDLPIRSYKSINDSIILFGTSNSELVILNANKKKQIYKTKIANSSVIDFESINDSIYNITSYKDIFQYNINQKKIVDTIVLTYNDERLSRFTFYRQENTTFWTSSDGSGMFYKSIKNKKFDIFPKSGEKPFVFNIKKIPNSENIILVDRNYDANILTKDGTYSSVFSRYTDNAKNFNFKQGVFLTKNEYLFFTDGKFFILNIDSYCSTRLANVNNLNLNASLHFHLTKNNKFIFIENPNRIIQGSVFKDKLYLKEIFKLKEIGKKIKSHFSNDNRKIFISNNEENLIILDYQLDTLIPTDTINIPGGIKSITETSSPDSIFLANAKGLFKINTNDSGFDKISGPDDVFNQTIYAIEQSSTYEYWLSSNNGLYYWHELKDSVVQFDVSDGLQGLEFNTGASYKDEDGTMYFGGVNGLNIFHPDSIKLDTTFAPVMISQYMIDDEVTKQFGSSYFVDSIELPYNRNTLSFRFHAQDYADMEATRVKYKMEGIDDDFIVSEKNEQSSRYPNLPPGNYTFRIIGANADRVWNKTERRVDITINPPYWQRWWFRILAILGIGGIIYLIFRSYYTRQLREKDFQLKEKELIISKQKALESERNRIAGEMHDDLGGGLTTISYLSQRLKGKFKDEKSEKQLNRIITHAKDLVSNMSEIIWAMNSGFDSLENLVAYTRRFASEYCQTHEHRLHFSNETQGHEFRVSGEIRRNTFLVIKEILHNTVKHAEASEIKLSFTFDGSQLKIEIGDNGKGIEEENPFGNGLKNMEERIEKIGGKLKRSSNQGLQYTIHIPLSTEVNPT